MHLAILLLVALALPAEAGDLAQCLPEGTEAYVSIRNLPETLARAKKSPLGALWDAPEMEAAREAVERLGPKGAEDSIGASECFERLTGEICFAAVPVAKSGVAVIALVELKGDRARTIDLLERLRKRDEGEGVRTEEQEFRGYTITTTHEPDGDDGKLKTTYTFVKDDLYGYGEDLDAIRDVIARRESGERTGLVSRPIFQRAVSAAGERSDVRFFIATSSIIRAVGNDPVVAMTLRVAGLDAVDGFGGGFALDSEGLSASVLLHLNGKPRRFLRLFENDVDDLGPPKEIPGDAGQCIAWCFDASVLYDEVMRVLGAWWPDWKPQWDAWVAESEKHLGYRLREDLFAALAPGTTISSIRGQPDGTGKPLEPTFSNVFKAYVLFQDLHDKEKILAVLEKLASFDGSPVKKVDYLGTTIYDASEAGGPAMAVVGNRLVCCLDPDSVRIAVRRSGKELKGYRDTEAYRTALKYAPRKRSLLMIQPKGWVMILRLGREDSDAMGAAFANSLPKFDWIRRYQGSNVLSISRAPHGLHVRAFWGLKLPDEE